MPGHVGQFDGEVEQIVYVADECGNPIDPVVVLGEGGDETIEGMNLDVMGALGIGEFAMLATRNPEEMTAEQRRIVGRRG